MLKRWWFCLFFGYCSHSFTVFHVYVKTMLVLMGGGGFVTILVTRFFSSFHTRATYMNRLDAVLGVDQIVLKDNSVAKINATHSF